MRAAPLALLLLLALAGPVTATLAVPYVATTRTLLLPQLACEVVFDVAGQASCDVRGPLTQANEVRVRTAGAARVITLVNDESTSTGIAYQDCSSSCFQGFRSLTTSAGVLHVRAYGQPGAAVSVSVQNGFGTLLA